ncbi:MAG: MBL fold metallo-hydrolase [Schleiferiaceae bacterium]|nr:MBL fold metallo-hydrolase [Schleiferiaceae bacterium]
MNALKIKLLGTGTSQGVPVIACECEVCSSNDPKDYRTRTAALFQTNQLNIAIDAGPDFRTQMLQAKVKHLDALLLTHEHMDHLAGLDDIRAFNFAAKAPLKVYAEKRVISRLLVQFDYAFAENPYPGVPKIELVEIDTNPFYINDLKVTPIRVLHHKLPVLGFRLGNISYVTDVNFIALEELEKIRGSEILVLSALHHKPHISHYNLEQALEVIATLNCKKNYITHMSHYMGLHQVVQKSLPENVWLGYDGLCIPQTVNT